jgi:hypothetical protein
VGARKEWRGEVLWEKRSGETSASGSSPPSEHSSSVPWPSPSVIRTILHDEHG